MVLATAPVDIPALKARSLAGCRRGRVGSEAQG